MNFFKCCKWKETPLSSVLVWQQGQPGTCWLDGTLF
jgi:hypothetical protein